MRNSSAGVVFERSRASVGRITAKSKVPATSHTAMPAIAQSWPYSDPPGRTDIAAIPKTGAMTTPSDADVRPDR